MPPPARQRRGDVPRGAASGLAPMPMRLPTYTTIRGRKLRIRVRGPWRRPGRPSSKGWRRRSGSRPRTEPLLPPCASVWLRDRRGSATWCWRIARTRTHRAHRRGMASFFSYVVAFVWESHRVALRADPPGRSRNAAFFEGRAVLDDWKSIPCTAVIRKLPDDNNSVLHAMRGRNRLFPGGQCVLHLHIAHF